MINKLTQRLSHKSDGNSIPSSAGVCAIPPISAAHFMNSHKSFQRDFLFFI
nr:MAG TPA: hypothetical protein [Caudoviricetes sp.]